jgi:hypothetical protein
MAVALVMTDAAVLEALQRLLFPPRYLLTWVEAADMVGKTRIWRSAWNCRALISGLEVEADDHELRTDESMELIFFE